MFVKTTLKTRRKWIIAAGVLGISAAVIAGTYPFVFAAFWPGKGYEDDRELNWEYAKSTPFRLMGMSVTSIKAGDVVRIVYPDGRVFDFPVTGTCSTHIRAGCPLAEPKQKSGPNAAADPTDIQIDRAIVDSLERENCYTGRSLNSSRRVSVNTGYWGSYAYASSDGSKITTVGTWISTGTYSYTMGAEIFNTRYRRMCL